MASETRAWPSMAAPTHPWPPRDTKESIPGAGRRQTTITSVRRGIDEAASLLLDERR